MDENDLAAAGEYQVGRAGQIPAVEPETIASGMKEFAHQHFRGCVLRANSPHCAGSQIIDRHYHTRRIGVMSDTF